MPRRKRTLPFASAGGPPPEAVIQQSDWENLEKLIQARISQQLRTELVNTTNNFLSFAQFELHVETIDGTIAKLAVLRKATGDLWKALRFGPHDAAAFYAKHLVELHLSDARLGPKHKMDQLCGIMTSLVVACAKADEDLQKADYAEIVPGECWNGWIKHLTSILNKHGLTTAVRKDSDKAKTSVPSPFVLFVEALQLQFPKEYRRGLHSRGALAEAIARARRVRKPTNR